MKKIILTLFLAIMATTGLYAQQISVVSSGGETSLYRTLGEAIQGAAPNSVIYLPGGGFTISDDVKITKKLTIIGIGHKSNNDNVDGNTTISGNLWFNEGSSGSAVMGCYIIGTVVIGDGDSTINDILIRYCNLNSVDVRNNKCQRTTINQNYIRNSISFNGAGGIVSNNILHSINNLVGGFVKNNILTSVRHYSTGELGYNTSYDHVIRGSNCTITNNVFISSYNPYYRGDCVTYGNILYNRDWGENSINMGNVDWNDVFVNFDGGTISPNSDFHFKDAYKQYESQVGIYAGTGFNDKQIAPVPFIIAKDVKEQTDASGKLNVKFRVKAVE